MWKTEKLVDQGTEEDFGDLERNLIELGVIERNYSDAELAFLG